MSLIRHKMDFGLSGLAIKSAVGAGFSGDGHGVCGAG